MDNNSYDRLPIAVRGYPDRKRQPHRQSGWQWPKGMLVIDTETRTDPTQKLTFGSYRIFWEGRFIREGLFHGDDLPECDLAILRNYVATGSSDAVERKLRLLTRRQFADVFFDLAYRRRYLIVAFNLPFDVARLSFDFTTARGRFAGGFSLELWSYTDSSGVVHPDPHRPRIAIKHIDSKRALKGFTSRRNPDARDRIPDGSETGKPENNYNFRGHFLDLRTLVFALTDKGHSLETACPTFGIEGQKLKISGHGTVTEEYIDYNRHDVLLTSRLAFKLLEEYKKHPIGLQPTKAYSPASVGKAYLESMGIPPVLERQPDFSKKHLGYATTGFFGGRTSAKIRKISVPVVYTDFLSMYPTVNSLMGLWSFVIADKIRLVEGCPDEVLRMLSELKPEDLFKPAMWKTLGGFVKVVPDGDILPCRAKYSPDNDWQVGINYVHDKDGKGFWYSLPDVVASVILTGRIPRIIDAFRIEPVGVLNGLKKLKLRGEVEVDPQTQDFFKVVIEQRKLVARRDVLTPEEKDRLEGALKVLANSTSYGIYAEMIREESDDVIRMMCYGCNGPFSCKVAHPDNPGRYCFPPVAALITGAARLMLALLEYSVSKRGGTYAMEDTDSMAIVATETGGKIPCPGGPYRLEDGSDAICALSWKQVEDIVHEFAALIPYDPSAVGGSILKIEPDNFDGPGKQRQLYCHAISAKRYVLFLKDGRGHPVLLRKKINSEKHHWSQHGLGHLINPTDIEEQDRDWIAKVWLNILQKSEGLPTKTLGFEDLPAIGRVTVSSPGIMRVFGKLNEKKSYSDQIKPFNFLLTCHLKSFGNPPGTKPEHFQLILPYELNSKKWVEMQWTDRYTGKQHGISIEAQHGTRRIAAVKTYADVIEAYALHPESKCADNAGIVCDARRVGLLQRRHIQIDGVTHIGKESNSLEEVEAGIEHSDENVYTVYHDPQEDEWTTKYYPALQRTAPELILQHVPLSRRMIMYARSGKRPRRKNRELIVTALQQLGAI
jgi:hypothetical protein